MERKDLCSESQLNLELRPCCCC
uniref:Uncharacterized protein n=1 Tax=Rhizophora mucronata TaxID=61149 RepID=A0A2P2Q8M5_RHIMU